MKRVIAAIMLTVMTFMAVCGCSKDKKPNITGEAQLTSKTENAMELQKSIFVCEVLSVTRQEALIPKYNSAITNYSVYTVKITDVLSGYAPAEQALVYCMGTAEDFIERIGLKQGEQYILDAEPWVYDNQIVFLLAPMTVAFPKIDSAGRVTLAKSESEADDCGTLEQYKKEVKSAKKSIEKRIDGFFEISSQLGRYIEMFDAIKEISDKNWFRDYTYDWTPSEELISATRAHCDKVCSYLHSLETKQDLSEEDLQKIFTI